MKVGKEGIAGTIAALDMWERRDHAAVRARETAALLLWRDTLSGRPGVAANIEPDPHRQPAGTLQVAVRAQDARITAWDLADRLASGPQPVIVRDHEIEHGCFLMDPCNLHPGEAEVVAKRLAEELDRAQQSNAVIATPVERSAGAADAGGSRLAGLKAPPCRLRSPPALRQAPRFATGAQHT